MDNVQVALPRKIDAVVFDLDDTLVLSTVDYGKFKKMVIDKIVSYGEPPSMYSPDETIVTILARYGQRMRATGIPEEERRRRASEFDRIMDEVELERASETSALPGAADLLKLLRSRGVKVGILTRGCDAYVASALSSAGLAGLVDATECRNSHTRAKPDPGSYLRLVERMGVMKAHTFFIGDHLIDARCAADAGVPFVAVETGDVPPEELRAAGSVAVFPDVGHMVQWFKSVLGVEPEKG